MDEATLPLSDNTKVPELYASEGDSKKEKEIPQLELVQPVIGLTKEQLEKYRNDPFWRTFRMFMFVLFWLIWVAMFAGAILIVVFSPKCGAKNNPEWWETKVNYQIFTPSFRDADGDGVGDFQGIAEKLEEIRKIGVQSVWATPVIATDKDDFEPYDVSDFEQVDERFGTADDLKHLVSEIHRLKMHFIMDLPITTTSRKHAWFVKATTGDQTFKDYYLRKEIGGTEADSSAEVLNGSAESYMIYNGKYPVLNWQNDNVRTTITNAAKKYLDFGIDGFHIPYVHQLGMRKPNRSAAEQAMEALVYFKSEMEDHVAKSEDLKGKTIVIFTSLGDFDQLDIPDSYAKGATNVSAVHYVIDDSMKKLSKESCAGNGVSLCIYDTLKRSLEYFQSRKLPPVWQFTDHQVSRLSSRFNPQIGNLLTFMELTLPGALEIYYGQEIGMVNAEEKTGQSTGLMQWDDSEKAGFTEKTKMDLFFGQTPDYKSVNYKAQYGSDRSSLKVFKALAKLRQRDDILLLGDLKLEPLKNDIITYVRKNNAEGNGAAYVIGLNFGRMENSLDIKPILDDLQLKSAEVVITTPEFNAYSPRDVLNADTPIMVPPLQGIMIRIK